MSDDKQPSKPWNEPLTDEAADRLLKAVKADPKDKNSEPKPSKGDS